MPPYAHLAATRIDFRGSQDKLRAMRNLGVPYRPEQIASAARDARAQAALISADLGKEGGVEVAKNSELVALIGYLQRLGKAPPSALEPARAGGPIQVSQLGGK
jgi:cytochrome c oxidase cbb3-type subunit I/II